MTKITTATDLELDMLEIIDSPILAPMPVTVPVMKSHARAGAISTLERKGLVKLGGSGRRKTIAITKRGQMALRS